MRALCGAIIAAGAMIGLGLTSIAIGTRYAAHPYLDKAGDPAQGPEHAYSQYQSTPYFSRYFQDAWLRYGQKA